LRCLVEVRSVYELVLRCLRHGSGLTEQALVLAIGEVLDYDALYAGRSEWRLLAPIDVPEASSRVTLSGTGLTHLGSAQSRDKMHASNAAARDSETDSIRMFRLGIAGGKPAAVVRRRRASS